MRPRTGGRRGNERFLLFRSAKSRDLEFAVGDRLLSVAELRDGAAAYLGTAPATDPRASPLFDRGQLPPTLIQVGFDEILRDDSRRFAEAASKAGTEALERVGRMSDGTHQTRTLIV